MEKSFNELKNGHHYKLFDEYERTYKLVFRGEYFVKQIDSRGKSNVYKLTDPNGEYFQESDEPVDDNEYGNVGDIEFHEYDGDEDAETYHEDNEKIILKKFREIEKGNLGHGKTRRGKSRRRKSHGKRRGKRGKSRRLF